jgi:hypothetical protein
VPGSQYQYYPERSVYAIFAALLEDFLPKPCAYQQQYSVQKQKNQNKYRKQHLNQNEI